MIDAQDGAELWSFNADRRMYPASLTKMMTGALACEQNQLDRVVTISQRAENVPETGIGLKAGERMTVGDLARAALIWSANDAALALGEAVSGNVDSFVTLMNQRAREWGAVNTHFVNPHGLHQNDHYATARDLGIIATHAMALPGFRQIVNMRSVTMMRPVDAPAVREGEGDLGAPPTGPVQTRERRVFTNRNRLLLSWDACDGVKSGYTRQAGRCLAASATLNGWRAIVVVLNAAQATEDCRRLLQWAHQNYEQRLVLKAGEGNWQLPVVDGASAKVPVVAARSLQMLVPKDAACPQPQVRVLGQTVTAPVQRGATVGKLQVVVQGAIRGEAPLVTAQTVELGLWGRVKRYTLPSQMDTGLLCLAVGVLLFGTAAKATRSRRRRFPSRRRATDRAGTGDGRRDSGDPVGQQGGSGD